MKLQKAAMLCFGSYCMRAMHSWRHAVWLRRLLKRGLESHEVCASHPASTMCIDAAPALLVV